MKYIAVLKSGYEQIIETDVNFQLLFWKKINRTGEMIFVDDKGVAILLDEIAIVKEYNAKDEIQPFYALKREPSYPYHIHINGTDGNLNSLSEKINEVLNKVPRQPRDFSGSLR